MDKLDEIKASLDNNTNLDQSIKDKLFELIIVFNKKLPNISLDKFNELAKTVKLGRIGKYESKGTSFYDVKNNIIGFSPDRLKLDYDLDNLFMRAELGMITSTGKFSGFNSDSDLYALNGAYEEILATYLVGNEEISDQEEEIVITNLIGNIIGTNILYDAYFSNNGNLIKNTLSNTEILDMLNHLKDAKLNNSLSPEIFSKIVDITNTLFCKSIMQNGTSKDVVERYAANSPRSDALFAYNHKGLEDVYKKFSENLSRVVKYANDNNLSNVNNEVVRAR